MTEIAIPDIPPAPAVPPYPALGAPNFNQMAYAVGMGMPGVVSGLNAIALAARQCALAARADALAVAAYVGVAQGAAGTATARAGDAAGSAAAAGASKDAAIAAAGSALESAEDSAGSAQGSEDSRLAAVQARQGAEQARSGAEDLRDEAKGYRDQAAVFATQQIKGSSSSSVTPGAGAKSFVIEVSRSFVAGMYVVATSTSDPATSMSGYVQSYGPATGALVIGVDMFSGASAKADWVIGVAAPGAASGLTRQVVTANTVCVAGVAYIVAAAGITLTLPTSWAAGDRIAIIEAIGNRQAYSIAYGATPLRGRALGTRSYEALYSATGTLTYQDSTRGLV